MKKRFFLSNLLVIVTLFSCSDNNEEKPETEGNLPISISIINPQNTANFKITYADNKIETLTGPHPTKVDRFYYQNSKLIKIDFEDIDGSYDLEYDSNNKLTRYYYSYLENSNIFTRTDLEYDGNSVTKTVYTKVNNEYVFTLTEKLTFNNGNITKTEDSTNSIVFEYNYGNGVSPFYNIDSFEEIQLILSNHSSRSHVRLRDLFVGENNLLKITNTIEEHINNFEYIFNENNLPREITNFDVENNVVETIEISY